MRTLGSKRTSKDTKRKRLWLKKRRAAIVAGAGLAPGEWVIVHYVTDCAPCGCVTHEYMSLDCTSVVTTSVRFLDSKHGSDGVDRCLNCGASWTASQTSERSGRDGDGSEGGVRQVDPLTVRCLLCRADRGEPCIQIDTEDGAHRIRWIEARGTYEPVTRPQEERR